MARRRQRKKTSIIIPLSIDGLSHDGRGLASLEGKRIFVEGALPDEQVEAEIYQRRSRFDEARTLAVINASAERVDPQCAHVALCGGCSLQHLSGDGQIAMKQASLLEQLNHFGAIHPIKVREPIRDSLYGYRRKARLAVRHVSKREEVLVGFREKASNFITDIRQCEVLDPRVGRLIMPLRELIVELDAARTIAQIEVAMGDEQTALVFRHLEPLSDNDCRQLVTFAREHALELYLQPGKITSVHKLYPPTTDDRLTYALPDFDLEMRFHPMDFTQVNAGVNQQMVKAAVTALNPQPGERVLDLFCGLGNFTLPLARSGAEVIGVEGSELMVERGFENARHNGVESVSFFAADLTQPFIDQPWASGGFDRILIDPPRSGAKEIVEEITKFNARRIVYVSCNPATLARDAGILKERGYDLLEVGIMDMFPHTAHVESLGVFERSNK